MLPKKQFLAARTPHDPPSFPLQPRYECPALKGIAEEGEEIIDDTQANTAQRDVGLIMAGQKAEQYEIVTYGSLQQLAKEMGQEEIADLLQKTLTEENPANYKLTELATKGINREAPQEVAD